MVASHRGWHVLSDSAGLSGGGGTSAFPGNFLMAPRYQPAPAVHRPLLAVRLLQEAASVTQALCDHPTPSLSPPLPILGSTEPHLQPDPRGLSCCAVSEGLGSSGDPVQVRPTPRALGTVLCSLPRQRVSFIFLYRVFSAEGFFPLAARRAYQISRSQSPKANKDAQ